LPPTAQWKGWVMKNAGAHAAADRARRLGLLLQRRVERQVHAALQVDGADDHADPAALPGDPHQLSQHAVGVALRDHGTGQRDIDRGIRQWQRLGPALAGFDQV
jgi:hypothetical protein